MILASRMGRFNERRQRRLQHPQEAPYGLDAGRDAGKEVGGVEQAPCLERGGVGTHGLEVAADEVLVAVVPRRFPPAQEPAGEPDLPGAETEGVRGGGTSRGDGVECNQPAIQEGKVRTLARTDAGPEGAGDGERQGVRGPPSYET